MGSKIGTVVSRIGPTSNFLTKMLDVSKEVFAIRIMVTNNQFFVIERTRDLIYLKFVATDFFQKIITPVLVKTPVT